MKLVMTLIARDEADIIDAQIAFHLNAGVDFVIAIDNDSQDGTTDILESYERDGYLHLIRDDREIQQGEWVTGIARLAATNFDADWVINSDVDGFWWPRGGTLKEIFDAVPRSFGCVRAMVRNFAPRPDGEGFFAEQMTVRVCNPGTQSNSPYSPRFQTAHRADPNVVVNTGNHHAFGRGLRPLLGWYPIDMLHFPIRSQRQCERKYLRWWEVVSRSGELPSPLWTAARDAHLRDRMHEFYESHLVRDDDLARGLATGTLAIDTRVRDVLRTLRAVESHGPRSFAIASKAPSLSFADNSIDEHYLSELAVLEDSSQFARAQRRVEALERRLAAAQTSVAPRIGRRLRAGWKRMTAGSGG
jgi:Glycosyl transferase family 2